RSDDGGQTWTNVTNNINTISPGLAAGATFYQLATHNSAGNNVVYVAINPNGVAVPGTPVQVFRSTNQGGSWTAMDTFPDVPGITGISGIAADPNLPNVVFM